MITHGWSAGHSALPAAVLSPDLHSGLPPPHPGSPPPGRGHKSFHPPSGAKPHIEQLRAGPGMAALSRAKGSVLLWCCGCCYPNHRHDLFQLPSLMGEFSESDEAGRFRLCPPGATGRKHLPGSTETCEQGPCPGQRGHPAECPSHTETHSSRPSSWWGRGPHSRGCPQVRPWGDPQRPL